jgi:hypothetical protein
MGHPGNPGSKKGILSEEIFHDMAYPEKTVFGMKRLSGHGY